MKIKINRIPHLSGIFMDRGTDVKWPTLRRTWLTDESVPELRRMAMKQGASIIFLDGMYRTNLNRHTDADPIERAVFFEYAVRSTRGTLEMLKMKTNREVEGSTIFLLCWIGNFHNGCIFHCGWQFPQVETWKMGTPYPWFERKALLVYRKCADILYKHGEEPMDPEVREFLG